MTGGNLLATKWGRLTAFFFLYAAEGIPHGFVQIAVTSEMGLRGFTAGEIGAFSGIITMPWAFKWAMGPVVDLVHSDRLGRRRGWIAAMQGLMVMAVLAGSAVDFSSSWMLFTALMVALNAFSATQDVAIDALACGVLKEDERGVANGLMFGGSYLGATVGGSGAMKIMPVIGYQASFWLVAATLVCILVCFTLRLREAAGPARKRVVGGALRSAGREVVAYGRQAFGAFFGTQAALVGAVVALLPIGAMAVSLNPVNAKLTVDLGFDKQNVELSRDLAFFNFVTGMVCTATCIAGGWLSEWIGRRRFIALCVVGTAVVTVGLAWILQSHGWTMPLEQPPTADRPSPASPDLVRWFWVASIAYSVFQGLMYGVRNALFMDVCTPAVAATQFTAYMALLNLTIAYSNGWQGWCCTRWGFPVMLAIDAVAGLICLALLPLMSKVKAAPVSPAASPMPSNP